VGNDFDQDIYDGDDDNFGGTTYADPSSPIHDTQNHSPKATSASTGARNNASPQSPVS
jgi:hypothetical protein